MLFIFSKRANLSGNVAVSDVVGALQRTLFVVVVFHDRYAGNSRWFPVTGIVLFTKEKLSYSNKNFNANFHFQ